jgi:hypothetical protein
MKIKRWDTTANNGNGGWVEDAPDVYIENIVASNAPSSSNFLRGDGVWANAGNTVNLTVTTASATVAKVTTETVTFAENVSYLVLFTLGNSVSSPTLNGINIRLGTSNASTTTFSLGANSLVPMYYNATTNVMQITGSYRTSDSTEDYNLRWENSVTAGETITRYKLIMEGIDGRFYPLTIGDTTAATKTVSTQQFRLNGTILMYNTTTTRAENAVFTDVWVSEYSSGTIHYTFNQSSGFVAYRSVYLKGTINSNGHFILDNTTLTSWLTQTLPTTDDGFVYVYLGITNNTTTAFRLEVTHPIYEFKDGKLRQYTPTHTHAIANVTGLQDALNLKAPLASPTFTGTVSGITATMVGLGNVTNESKATMFTSPTFTGTVSGVTKTHVGLGNVDNTSDANKPVSTAQQTALDLKLNTSLKGANSGLAELDSSGKVPAAQLPSYVDDVIMFDPLYDTVKFSSTNPTGSTAGSLNEILYSFQSNLYYCCSVVNPPTGYVWTSFGGGGTIPADGFETGKIYVATTSNKTYRWGSGLPKDGTIVEISASLALGSTSSTAHRGDHGATAYTHSQVTNGTNPHNTTFANIASKPTTLSGYGITDAEPAFTKNTGFNKNFGTTSGTVAQGNDSRFSDARTPLSHTHGNITNAGAIGTTASLPIITTTSGVLTTGSFGTTAGTFAQGNDSRLSDARTPLAHTHGNITNAGAIGSTADLVAVTTTSGVLTTASRSGIDTRTSFPPSAHGHTIFDVADLTTELAAKEPAFTKNTGFNKNFGTTAGTVSEGNHTHAASAITSGTLAVAQGGTGQTTLALARNAMGLGNTTGALPVANGGTNATSVAQGGIIYGASTSAYASTAAGTSNSSQYLLSNGTSAPTFTSIFYCRILTSGVSTSVSSTVAVSVFDIALPIGSYHFETLGTITKNGATSKAYQILFTCDNTTGYTRLQGDVLFSPNTAFTANTGNAMSGFNNTVVNVVSSNITTPTSGSYFQGTTNTSAISNMPYRVSGIIVLTSARNFRMHIRQTAASTADTVVVNAGSFMKITRLG